MDNDLDFASREADSEDECPYCHARFIEFLRFEGSAGNGVKVCLCKSCDTIFKISSEIPF